MKLLKVKIVFVFLASIATHSITYAQKKVELKSAENLYGGIDDQGHKNYGMNGKLAYKWR